MGLVRCPDCNGNVSELASHCPQCGGPLAIGVMSPAQITAALKRIPQTETEKREALLKELKRQRPVDDDSPQRVLIADFDMPFRSMVGFMVKWAIAAIPAAIILAVIMGFVSSVFFGGCLGSLLKH